MTSVAARIQGSIPALVTPMRNGKVDEQAFRKFVSWQIEQGSHGLTPCGTTGKSPPSAMRNICGWWKFVSKKRRAGCQ